MFYCCAALESHRGWKVQVGLQERIRAEAQTGCDFSWHDGLVEPRTATFADRSNLSPNYTTDEVLRNPTLGRKIDVLVDQVENWIIAPAEALLSMPHAPRAVLAIATSYFELIALSGRPRE
jgi:hypothetical protein